jgi:hypothetical protein
MDHPAAGVVPRQGLTKLLESPWRCRMGLGMVAHETHPALLGIESTPEAESVEQIFPGCTRRDSNPQLEPEFVGNSGLTPNLTTASALRRSRNRPRRAIRNLVAPVAR